ncbi:Protein of unknown function [Paraoerskovia marina]|uniref:GmrSD restriction endonucleases C-terminal domain-containing protein n=1 Tax=Paraoerskovia marina TaxID=545619 RepID=A0A1H1NL26_9CELL|nr:HNH endonuclease family protein [Paraoerskovia marina]SDR99627.1 Protein of unknown function [Paraoerskovia marina]
MSSGRTPRWSLALVVVALVVTGGISFKELAGDETTKTLTTVSADQLDRAETDLASLSVGDRGVLDGYDRDAFDHWTDPDGNGCDTRNDILARDLAAETVDDDGCTVLTGTLTDPYGGETIDFERGEHSAEVQIDHVVALANAWRTGADAWDDTTREEFANDPANLLAVDGPLNGQKSASDAAGWLPPAAGFRCAYVVRQIEVKAGYGLSVTADEHDTMAEALDSCTVADTRG